MHTGVVYQMLDLLLSERERLGTGQKLPRAVLLEPGVFHLMMRTIRQGIGSFFILHQTTPRERIGSRGVAQISLLSLFVCLFVYILFMTSRDSSLELSCSGG